MVRLEIQDCFEQPSLDEIHAWEVAHAVSFPVNYRSFLLHFNGGSFSDSAVFIRDDQKEIAIGSFFGIHTGFRYSDLSFYRSVIGLPSSRYLPIADDPGGNLFLINADDDLDEAVYFRDHETGRLTRIASSFGYLLSHIFLAQSREQAIRARGDLVAAACLGELDLLSAWVQSHDIGSYFSEFGMTLLMHAASMRCPKSVKWISQKTSLVGTLNVHGRSALHFGAKGGSIDCCRCLLDHGCLIDAQDANGITPLMEAIANSNIRVVKYLSDCGANHTILNSDGESARELAAESPYAEEIQSILSRQE